MVIWDISSVVQQKCSGPIIWVIEFMFSNEKSLTCIIVNKNLVHYHQFSTLQPLALQFVNNFVNSKLINGVTPMDWDNLQSFCYIMPRTPLKGHLRIYFAQKFDHFFHCPYLFSKPSPFASPFRLRTTLYLTDLLILGMFCRLICLPEVVPLIDV